MIESDRIRDSVASFITQNFLFGDERKKPSASDSLIGKGILDSTGILELIDYLEKEFGIVVEDQETVPDNLDSIDNIVNYVGKKSVS